ncbi:MAG TPA: hypothetical protein VES90_10550 [Candidatus Eisenbacteria bacterium]|nr:hypothetical protein [Candidatus Eisenbacteria bacterium]
MTQERDLRSLERRSMYAIFAPLDPNERLPRELILEGRRHRMLGRRELAGALWLPALFLILFLAGWGKVDAAIAVAVIAFAFVGLWAFVLFGDRHSD